MPCGTRTIPKPLATIIKQVKKIIIVIFSLIIISCNEDSKRNLDSVKKFERILGEKEVSYLDEMIKDFEIFLNQNYPDQELKFKSYLTDISESQADIYWEIKPTDLRKYKESRLFNKYNESLPDTVWFDGRTINYEYTEHQVTGEIIPIQKRAKRLNIDSAILAVKNEPDFFIIEQSLFNIALDSVRLSDSLINKYLNAKDASGALPPSSLARGISYSLNEENEYFAKRIYIMNRFE
tara:strand:- start:169 stop:879 length:711 start_codon:yes stop_codon:yes gene_type:complete